MRHSKLTLMLVGLFAGGASLPMSGCFITTESDRFSDTDAGPDDDGSNSTNGNNNSCPVGMPGCACTNSGACDEALECIDMLNICVVPTGCDIGSAGCECTKGGTCDEGLMCADVDPSPGICVSDNPCLDEFIGTEGCQCTQGGGCDTNLDCVSGLCVDLPDPAGTTTGEPGTTDGGGDSSSTGSPDDTTGSAETGSMPTSG